MSQSAVRFERVMTGGATGLQKIQYGSLVASRLRVYNALVDPPVLFAPSGGAFITITDPNGTAVVTNGSMSAGTTGVYTYNWQSTTSATLGDYVITFKTIDSTGTVYEPAAVGFVLVNEVGVATTPGTLVGINADFLLGFTWGSPGAIGATAPNTGAFTTLTATSLTGLNTIAIRDTSAAFDVTLAATSSPALTAGRTLTFDLSNAARTINLTGSPTLDDWFDQSVKTTAVPSLTGLGIGIAAPSTGAILEVKGASATNSTDVTGLIPGLANFYQGSTASPATTVGSTIVAVREETVATIGNLGGAILAKTISRGAAQGQAVVGITTSHGAGDSVPFLGVGLTDGAGTAFGGYLEARANAASSHAVTLQMTVRNNTGANHSWDPSVFPTTAGFDIDYDGGAGLNTGGCALMLRAGGAGQWDVGIGTSLIGSGGPIKTTFIRDDSGAVRSIDLRGSHTDGVDTTNGTFSGSPLKGTGYSVGPTGVITGTRLVSTIAVGTAPLTVTSTTLVSNLYVARAALADTTTTIPNLTGPITSVGVATSVASQTGTGSTFVMQASPTLTTPNIGAATGTTLTLSDGANGLIAAGAGSLFVRPASGAGLVSFDVGNARFTNLIQVVPVAAPSTPAASIADIYVDSTSKNLASKNDAGTVNHGIQSVSGAINDDGSITSSGSAGLARTTSPSFTTPALGVATATSINKVALTAPATSATLTIADGKTLTASASLALAGTDSTTLTFQGTDTYVGRATTDTLTNKTLTSPTITGGAHTAITSLGIRSTGAAFDLTIASTEVLTAGRTLTVTLNDAARTVSLAGNLTLAGAFVTAGAFSVTLTATATTTLTLPTTGTLTTLAGSESLSNKTLVTPVLGVATGTSVALTALSSINANAAALPTAITGTLLRIQQDNATGNVMLMDSAAGSNRLWGRRVGNTIASPAATEAAATILSLGAVVYDTTNQYSAAANISGGILIQAVSASSSTDHSTQIVLQTTPVGSTVLTTAATFGSDQTLNVVGAYKSNGTTGVTQTASAVSVLATIGGIVTTFTPVSDERLKDWTPYRRGLDELLGLEPIRYHWNAVAIAHNPAFAQAGEGFGWSAQNLREAMPEIVGTERWPDGREWLTLRSDRAIAAMTVNAVKELAARVEALERRERP